MNIIDTIKGNNQNIIDTVEAGDRIKVNGKRTYTVVAKGEGRFATLVEVKGARGAERMISWNNQLRGGSIFSMSSNAVSLAIKTIELA